MIIAESLCPPLPKSERAEFITPTSVTQIPYLAFTSDALGLPALAPGREANGVVAEVNDPHGQRFRGAVGLVRDEAYVLFICNGHGRRLGEKSAAGNSG